MLSPCASVRKNRLGWAFAIERKRASEVSNDSRARRSSVMSRLMPITRNGFPSGSRSKIISDRHQRPSRPAKSNFACDCFCAKATAITCSNFGASSSAAKRVPSSRSESVPRISAAPSPHCVFPVTKSRSQKTIPAARVARRNRSSSWPVDPQLGRSEFSLISPVIPRFRSRLKRFLPDWPTCFAHGGC